MRTLTTVQMRAIRGGDDCDNLLATALLALAAPGGELVGAGLLAAYVLKCTNQS